MPIHRAGKGFQWGSKGKVYPTKAGAQRQARAAYANGYREPSKASRARPRSRG